MPKINKLKPGCLLAVLIFLPCLILLLGWLSARTPK